MQIDFYEIRVHDDFTKQVERLTKKKRYFTLPLQIRELFASFAKGEFQGERIKHRDEPETFDVYKMRLPNPDANIGKSGGYRIVYMVITEQCIVVFLAIYSKKEHADLPDDYISGLIDGVLLDILSEDDLN